MSGFADVQIVHAFNSLSCRIVCNQAHESKREFNILQSPGHTGKIYIISMDNRIVLLVLV